MITINISKIIKNPYPEISDEVFKKYYEALLAAIRAIPAE
jgi:hypothetical protein